MGDVAAPTEPAAGGGAFRGRTLRDRVMRSGLRALFLEAKLIGRPNKMLVAERKVSPA